MKKEFLMLDIDFEINKCHYDGIIRLVTPFKTIVENVDMSIQKAFQHHNIEIFLDKDGNIRNFLILEFSRVGKMKSLMFIAQLAKYVKTGSYIKIFIEPEHELRKMVFIDGLVKLYKANITWSETKERFYGNM